MKTSGKRTYFIKVFGKANGDLLNASSPVEMVSEGSDSETSLLTIFSDQAGLIGTLRFLHARGFQILSVDVKADEEKKN